MFAAPKKITQIKGLYWLVATLAPAHGTPVGNPRSYDSNLVIWLWLFCGNGGRTSDFSDIIARSGFRLPGDFQDQTMLPVIGTKFSCLTSDLCWTSGPRGDSRELGPDSIGFCAAPEILTDDGGVEADLEASIILWRLLVKSKNVKKIHKRQISDISKSSFWNRCPISIKLRPWRPSAASRRDRMWNKAAMRCRSSRRLAVRAAVRANAARHGKWDRFDWRRR